MMSRRIKKKIGEARDEEDEEEKEEEQRERARVRAFLRREVQDWDDPVKAVVRFKGFSGQRSDWEGRYLFWRDLILKVARHLGTFIIRPSRINDIWFRREGALSPLCLDQVLCEMFNAGDILRESDFVDPTSTRAGGRLSLVFWKAVHALGFSTQSSSSTPHNYNYLSEDYYILSAVLKDRALEVINLLSESHWTSSCVITRRKFQEVCGGSKEASAVLSYLSGCQKAKCLMVTKNDVIEGLKVSLSPGAVSDISSLDYDILHLIWTVENLEQQRDVIEQRCQNLEYRYKRLAVAYLRSGNRKLALRHAKELKLAFQSREKCTVLLNRVEEVLRVIGDTESSRKVCEAIDLSAKAIRDNRISTEEVELSLQDINMSIESLKHMEEVLGMTSPCEMIEDEDIEDELKMLEIEIEGGKIREPSVEVGVISSAVVPGTSEAVDSLSDSLSNLNFKSSIATKTVKDCVSG